VRRPRRRRTTLCVTTPAGGGKITAEPLPSEFMSDPISTVWVMDIPLQRVTAIHTAIELGVDDVDFRFESLVERDLWNELLAEHEARVDMSDSVWIAA